MTAVGGITGLYAYAAPFEQTRLFVGLGAGCYLLLWGLNNLWLMYSITSTCFRGTVAGSKKEIWVQSKLELPAADYRLTLLSPKDSRPLKCTRAWNIGTWIREDGIVAGDAFCKDMAAFIKSDDFKSNIRSD